MDDSIERGVEDLNKLFKATGIEYKIEIGGRVTSVDDFIHMGLHRENSEYLQKILEKSAEILQRAHITPTFRRLILDVLETHYLIGASAQPLLPELGVYESRRGIFDPYDAPRIEARHLLETGKDMSEPDFLIWYLDYVAYHGQKPEVYHSFYR